MNIRQLSVFRTVCQELNFTRAAERLFMTQPAVSHVISDLEEETGTKLFDRLSKKIYLTEAGKVFLEKGVRVLDAYDDLIQAAATAESKAILRLGSSITIANTWLPLILKEFEKNCSETMVKVEINSAAHIERRLRANDLDLAFIEGDIGGDELITTYVSSYKMAFFCCESHPFNDRESVSVEELIGQRLILREKGSAIRDSFDSALLLLHTSVEPAWTSTNSQAIIQAVKQGLGVSLLPECLLEEEFCSGRLKPFHIDGLELCNNNYIAAHRDKHWTVPMKMLADIVIKSSADATQSPYDR